MIGFKKSVVIGFVLLFIWNCVLTVRAPKIVSVDVAGIVRFVSAKEVLRSIKESSDQDKGKVVTTLKTTLREYAKKNNVIVLDQASVVEGNVTDITNTIIQEILAHDSK
jgi:hypothetical protein